jgi:pentatricopeptide repeat protein
MCGYCQSRLISEALSLFDQMIMDNCVSTIVTYNTLIDGLCKAERYQQASIFTKEMIQKGFKPNK